MVGAEKRERLPDAEPGSRSHLVPISFRISFWFLLLLNFPCCDEWAVHSVICCRWCESWNEFSVCSTQCAHGLVKTWWCQWPVCWMSRAQCDLLLVAWESDWVFFVFYNTVRLVLLRFGDVSGCAEWAVHSVICCWWHESRIGFSLCFTTLCVWFC